MSEIPERHSAAHVPHGVRPPGPATGNRHAALRSGHHRDSGVPVRLVLGQPTGRAARGHRVQPDAYLVPGLVQQPIEPRVRDHAELAVPEAGDVRPTFLERRRLRDHLRVLPVRGLGRHGDGPKIFRRPQADRRGLAPQRVRGISQHACQLRHAQTAGSQFQGDRWNTPQTAQTIAHRKHNELNN